MRRILLLMSTRTYRAGAFLASASRLKLAVTVGSERAQILAPANPAGHLVLDFRELARAVLDIVEFARREPLAAVVAADDDGAALAAIASQALGLRHNPPAAALAALDKHRTRQALSSAGLPTPNFELLPLEGGPPAGPPGVGFPCVLKPLHLAASRGVIRADDEEQFRKAFDRIARLLRRPEIAALGGPGAWHLLAESYIPGTEVALEGLLRDGQLRTLAIFEKPDPLDGPFFEETIYIMPARLSEPLKEALHGCVAQAAAALGLREGPVHAEVRINPRGLWPLEIAPRSIGGLCSRVLRFSGGATLEDLILLHALGQDTDSILLEPGAAGVMMIPITRAGILEGVRGQQAAAAVRGIEEIRIAIPTGDRVEPWPEGSRYLGFIFARAAAPDEIEPALREAHRHLEFSIADDPDITRQQLPSAPRDSERRHA